MCVNERTHSVCLVLSKVKIAVLCRLASRLSCFTSMKTQNHRTKKSKIRSTLFLSLNFSSLNTNSKQIQPTHNLYNKYMHYIWINKSLTNTIHKALLIKHNPHWIHKNWISLSEIMTDEWWMSSKIDTLRKQTNYSKCYKNTPTSSLIQYCLSLYLWQV